ncbi:hypothetical protein BCR42DRAFT_490313 [Absidia repens]|uniref:C2H2-type domain-containing protein n=1 Tax=Absidia repens TaxID=90262 RepID=A0A1X2IMN8_9FUNG|nr:hypothetical protein BCR42DRAFT_490313 [Absidia repens]
MSTTMKSPSTLPATISPLQQQQEEEQLRKEHWRGDLPPPPSNLTFCPPNQERYPNSLNIINRHGNLLSLIDAVYPPTICQICDTELASPAETDQHYQAKHSQQSFQYSNKKFKPKQRYLCLSPHCDQTFRSRGLLRLHISTCHLVDNEQVPKTDPLYMLYAPPSLVVSSSSDLLGNSNVSNGAGGSLMMMPQKRKYERKQKTWNPVGKSSLPGQTNFTLAGSDMNMEQQPQPKRRGRPPKIKSVMPLSNMINKNNTTPVINNNNNNNNDNTSPINSNTNGKKKSSSNDDVIDLNGSNTNNTIPINEHASKFIRPSPSMITFSSCSPGKKKEPNKIQDPLAMSLMSKFSATPKPEPKPQSHSQSKAFRKVQQDAPQRAITNNTTSIPSSSFSTTTTPTARSKNISRSNLSQTSQRLLAERYNPLECPACQMTFQRKKNVARHLATEHAGEECFQCIYSDCYHPKRFSTREGLVYHVLHSHDTNGAGGFKTNKITNGGGGSTEAGSDTSASELAMMDSSDTASMDDDHYDTVLENQWSNTTYGYTFSTRTQETILMLAL